MESARSLPFLKILSALLIGIIYANNFLHLNWIYCFPFVFLSLLIVVLFNKWTLLNLGKKKITSLSVYLHIFFWGVFISKYNEIDTISEPGRDEIQVLQQISPWKSMKNNYQCELSFTKPSLYKKGRVLFSLYQDAPPSSIPGDYLFITTAIRSIRPALNPNQFDYKKFNLRKGIAYSSYSDTSPLFFRSNSFHFARVLTKLRKQIIAIYEGMPLNKTANAFIKALVLGDKTELDPDLKKTFSEAGVIHVLAVSGLHVGIIVLLFSQLFFFLRFIGSRGLRQFLKSLFLLIIIWTFAGISEFSPSIIRAAIMFSFLTIGQLLLRHTNIYNSLCLAAFSMLFINPSYLFMVGFQLSFLAVIGIVFFYPLIYKLLFFKYKLLRYFWGLIAVSISAQIITFPISIFYFNQFPIYFILSNLIVIPAIFLILLLSILLLFFSFSALISKPISLLINSLIEILYSLIKTLNQLPFHSYKGMFFDQVDLFILFAIIGCIMFFIKSKKPIFISSALLLSCLFFARSIYIKSKNFRSNEFIIYSLNKKTAIDLYANNEHFLFLDSSAFDQLELIKKIGGKTWQQKGISNINNKAYLLFENEIIISDHFILSKNHLIFRNTILCFNHSSHRNLQMQHFAKRICLLNSIKIKSKMDIENYSSIVFNDGKTALFPMKNSAFRKNKQSSKFHSLRHSGAFIMPLK